MLGEMRMYFRFARDLRRFLKEPITLEQSQKIIKKFENSFSCIIMNNIVCSRFKYRAYAVIIFDSSDGTPQLTCISLHGLIKVKSFKHM